MIRSRKDKNGKPRYQAIIKKKGYPPNDICLIFNSDLNLESILNTGVPNPSISQSNGCSPYIFCLKKPLFSSSNANRISWERLATGLADNIVIELTSIKGPEIASCEV